MIDNREVGRRIAALRQERALTQMQLAAMMNVSHQAVSKWESGAAMPDIQTLMELTRFFGVTVEQLIGSAGAEDAREEEPERAGEPASARDEQERPDCKGANNMDIRQLLKMAPFMTKEAVEEIALGLEGPLTAEEIARIAPYLSQEGVETLVARHHPEFTWDSLRRIAPHMRRETVDELARAIASGRETVKSSEDSFNRTMNDIGRAFDSFGKGMDKAVRKAIRFGGSVLNEVSSAFSELANEAPSEDANARSDRARELRRRAFARALADGRWDWLGEHVSELADGDPLKCEIAARARELGMREWLAEFMDGWVDEEAAEAALASGDFDWLLAHIAELEPEWQLRAARAAVEARNWQWLENVLNEIDLAGAAEDFAREVWRAGNAELAARFAEARFCGTEQFDALFREAVAAGDEGLSEPLWDFVSPACAREQLANLAERGDWKQAKAHVDCADGETLEKLMELAVEQGDFEAVDFLDPYL